MVRDKTFLQKLWRPWWVGVIYSHALTARSSIPPAYRISRTTHPVSWQVDVMKTDHILHPMWYPFPWQPSIWSTFEWLRVMSVEAPWMKYSFWWLWIIRNNENLHQISYGKFKRELCTLNFDGDAPFTFKHWWKHKIRNGKLGEKQESKEAWTY